MARVGVSLQWESEKKSNIRWARLLASLWLFLPAVMLAFLPTFDAHADTDIKSPQMLLLAAAYGLLITRLVKPLAQWQQLKRFTRVLCAIVILPVMSMFCSILALVSVYAVYTLVVGEPFTQTVVAYATYHDSRRGCDYEVKHGSSPAFTCISSEDYQRLRGRPLAVTVSGLRTSFGDVWLKVRLPREVSQAPAADRSPPDAVAASTAH